jgi:hypothetical protein
LTWKLWPTSSEHEGQVKLGVTPGGVQLSGRM